MCSLVVALAVSGPRQLLPRCPPLSSPCRRPPRTPPPLPQPHPRPPAPATSPTPLPSRNQVQMVPTHVDAPGATSELSTSVTASCVSAASSRPNPGRGGVENSDPIVHRRTTCLQRGVLMTRFVVPYSEHVLSSQGQPCSLAHRNTFRCPPSSGVQRTSPRHKASRAPAPTAAPPGARHKRRVNTYPRPDGSIVNCRAIVNVG